jgi:acetyl esterase/lipase
MASMTAGVARRCIALGGALAVVAVVGSCGGGPAVDEDTARTTRPAEATVDYLPGVAADVYTPAVRRSSTPVVVLIPGGGWVTADRSGLAPLAERLSAGGAFVVNATYRAARDAVVFPRPVQDILCAAAFAADRARADGLAPGPMIVIGHSSGAHLAALAALGAVTPDGSCPYPARSPDGFAGLAGLYDISTATDAVAPLIGSSPRDAPDVWRAANAMTWVASRPTLAVFLAHGDADELVPMSETSSFAAALEHSGHPVQVQIVPAAGHHDLYKPDVIAALLQDWIDAAA